MLNGIPKQHEAHGNDARLHVVVLKLLLHKLLQLWKFDDILIDGLVRLHKVSKYGRLLIRAEVVIGEVK